MKSYIVWSSMLHRCYSPLQHLDLSRNPTYDNCEVCEEWFSFKNFETWFNENYREGYSLDKDILTEGNHLYSPETCCFVPPSLNTAVISRQTKGTYLPTGVSKVKPDTYQVIMKRRGKPKRIGTFHDVTVAAEAYRKAKQAYVREIAEQFYATGAISEKIKCAVYRLEFRETLNPQMVERENEIVKRYKEEIEHKQQLIMQYLHVAQVDDNGVVVNMFPNYTEAARQFGVIGHRPLAISRCCRGEKTSYNGYRWFDRADVKVGDIIADKITHTDTNIVKYYDAVPEKTILQIKDGEIINHFKSFSDAGKQYNSKHSADKISECCRGIRKTYKNCKWELHEDANE